MRFTTQRVICTILWFFRVVGLGQIPFWVWFEYFWEKLQLHFQAIPSTTKDHFSVAAVANFWLYAERYWAEVS